MTAILDVTTPASSTALTTLARVRSDLNLSSSLYADAFVTQMIASASAAIVSWLNIASDGENQPTLGLETVNETFRDVYRGVEAVALARAPIADVVSVEEDGGLVARLQSGADGAVDILAGATTFSSALGPDGAGFNSGHVGKEIVIAGAGAAGAALTTTIAAFVDAQNVTLDAAAQTTVAAAAFTIQNPAFSYEWRRGSALLWKLSGGYRASWASRLVRVVYSAGYVLPGDVAPAVRNLPTDIEDACILLVRRKIDQLRESETENRRIKSESFPGIGAWTYALEDIAWTGGLPSDVIAMLQRYRRISV